RLRVVAGRARGAAPAFGLVHAIALARPRLLLPLERFRPPRELAHAVEQVAAFLLAGPLLDAARRLVVRLLLAPQRAVEQRRQILLRPVGAAASAARLLTRDLGPPLLRIGAQQVVERLHLRRQRFI